MALVTRPSDPTLEEEFKNLIEMGTYQDEAPEEEEPQNERGRHGLIRERPHEEPRREMMMATLLADYEPEGDESKDAEELRTHPLDMEPTVMTDDP